MPAYRIKGLQITPSVGELDGSSVVSVASSDGKIQLYTVTVNEVCLPTRSFKFSVGLVWILYLPGK